jgi:nucleoside-diphosphate-sugar epimerase
VAKGARHPVLESAFRGGKVRVLVTGSSGFFGSWLCPGLEELGHEVVPYDIRQGCDIFNEEKLLDTMADCDGVVHLAAIPHYDEKINPQSYQDLNVWGTIAVATAFEELARPEAMVYMSSGALYGFGAQRPMCGWVTPPIRESIISSAYQVAWLDAYGKSKAYAEAALEEMVAKPTVALRVNCIEPYHFGAKD